jgi:hypothetical protein
LTPEEWHTELVQAMQARTTGKAEEVPIILGTVTSPSIHVQYIYWVYDMLGIQ